jgi:hypothetical protein
MTPAASKTQEAVQLRKDFFKGVLLGATVSSLVLTAATALAGTGVGAVFNLGRTNKVNAQSTLTGAAGRRILQITNTGSGAGLGIRVRAGKAPIAVNASAGKATNLNADKLDGHNASDFSQVVAKFEGSSPLHLTGSYQVYRLGTSTYTQPGNEDDTYIGALDVTFAATCTAPRSVLAAVLVDAPDPLHPDSGEEVAAGVLDDSIGGNLTGRVELGPANIASGTSGRFAPGTAKRRTVTVIVWDGCNSGSGATVTFAAVHVIGTKA